MKFSSEKLQESILESFDSIGFKPRGFQVQVIEQIVDAFLNKNKVSVVCSLDTGAGKSIIGAIVADVVDKLTIDVSTEFASIITMGQNSLAKQYFDTFNKQPENRYFQVMGASNYQCSFMESQPSATNKTAEECVESKLHDAEKTKYCVNLGCKYYAAKRRINATSNLITNNSYFLISKLASGHLLSRKMHIFDEAHNLNDAYCSYTEIVVSVDILNKYINELTDTNGKCDSYIADLILVKNDLSSNIIHEDNYIDYLHKLREAYLQISIVLASQSKGLEKIDIVKSSKYDKMSRKYIHLHDKIRDYFDYPNDRVFDDSVQNMFTVKSVFINKQIDKLLARYNLFMSATITETYVYDILNLDKEDTFFLETPPVFPPENKPIFFIGKTALNYEAMKDPDTIKNMKNQIKVILEHHSDDSGLIIVPSFFLGSQLANNVKSHKVYEHKSGMNLPSLIDDFKRDNKPSILISPSIFEGLDFKGDVSRFQIITKSPYPSLGDKRIKYIANKYPIVYKEMTLIKIIQGIGRSIRSEDDFAATYCLDKSTEKLFNMTINIWKNRFNVIMKG